ncbi:hypothetical protein F3Y22_tig00111088pilonHSYRG00007 [Hibiscus syriacus]|uniref:Pentatricopeptide repeat-containing protein n=1 Tax=Hibiscus syriacus TaxID=106335 RepID=A0A6A2Z368_HIBSY|nr:hypothetical protein F3Y22_tig00111088pilonHSYRG00007 [Hibiscus syriacus]
MMAEGTRPDSSTFTIAIKACVNLIDLKMGEEIWRKADDAKVVLTRCQEGILSVGLLWEQGLCRVGGHVKRLIYRKMQMDGMEGDGVVMLGLIRASVNLGDSKLGLAIHGYMIRKCLSMDVVVQTSILDMCSYGKFTVWVVKLGQVEEAYRLIETMNHEPGATVWVALLSGCCNHGNLYKGEVAAKKVLELNPDDLGIHALVSNFFAKGNMRDEVGAVRKLMKNSGKKKGPGYSVLDVNGKLHAFVMGDKATMNMKL